MSALLILFFASLIGITIMIGRKLISLKNQPVVTEEKIIIESPDLKEIRYIFVRKSREYGYIALVEIIRFSVRSSKFLKRKYKETKHKIRSIAKKHVPHKEETKQNEVSGFLKKVSEYKHKLRKIKNKVVEEENEIK